MGEGSLSLLFFEISADFDISWGEEEDTKLPEISVIPLLKAELEKPESWRALLPTSGNLLVALRELDSTSETDDLVLHPVGTLEINQKLLPLDLDGTRLSEARRRAVGRHADRIGTRRRGPGAPRRGSGHPAVRAGAGGGGAGRGSCWQRSWWGRWRSSRCGRGSR